MVSWLLRYAFALFDGIVLGQREPPVLSYEMVNPFSEWRPFFQLVIVLSFYSATKLLEGMTSDLVLTAIRLAGLVILPASVAALGVTGSLLQAINPRTVIPLIYRLGWSYLVVLSCVAMLAVAARVLTVRPDYLLSSTPIVMAVGAYAWLATFSVLATAIYERRLTLGLETWYSPEQSEMRAKVAREIERDLLIDELYRHWRVKSYSNAWQALQAHISTVSNPMQEYLWIHERVGGWPEPQLAERVARALLPLLLGARQDALALEVLRSRLKVNAKFRPTHAHDLVRLARIACDVGDRSTARVSLEGFEKYYPGDRAKAIVIEMRAALER
jgi:hypothetical protein